MSKTTRKQIFTDPILRKGHYHATKLKEPDVDEELDFFFAEMDAELERQRQHEWEQRAQEDGEHEEG